MFSLSAHVVDRRCRCGTDVQHAERATGPTCRSLVPPSPAIPMGRRAAAGAPLLPGHLCWPWRAFRRRHGLMGRGHLCPSGFHCFTSPFLLASTAGQPNALAPDHQDAETATRTCRRPPPATREQTCCESARRLRFRQTHARVRHNAYARTCAGRDNNSSSLRGCRGGHHIRCRCAWKWLRSKSVAHEI